ncbi:MAG: thioredoxin domain-containing protein [Cyanobacteriota bacterium SKYGB_h_bin112]|nr:thioredoxin domain-containing protein [Cyanobacteriota bacterium SKYGB_h_bin112]
MPNRLAHARSLYLRKHADNPIAWWEWCPEALETARREDKPIFLSIGYSSCHWCTVMEGEAFSDPDIAAYMNANFLPIKVDREERPDLDSIYMQALQMMTEQGGWPLNVFLSPDDLVPFYGGTYFPVEPRYGRPGFLKILQALRQYYDNDKQDLKAVQQKILARLQGMAQLRVDRVSLLPSATGDLLKQGIEANTKFLRFRDYGPSFPMIPYAELVLRGEGAISPASPPSAAYQRGLNLALGGIYDHVGGGFHRYTVDPTWTVPHFEKMLYDNGQIVEYLANLWAAGAQEPAFERAIVLTVAWLQREMTAPEGYFYAAQDADSFTTPNDAEPEEGAFYVWDYQELQNVLTDDELAELTEQFTVSTSGNFEGHNVLQRRQPGRLSDRLETALTKLFCIRYGANPGELTTFPPARNNHEAKTQPWPGRIPPVTDTKMIVAWNSLMISGLARAAVVFQRKNYWQLASRAAQFILDRQWLNDRFHRLNYDGQAAVPAQSEDYALFIKALLDLHQASLLLGQSSACNETQTPDDWLTHAVRVQAEFDEFLWSLETDGYYNAAVDNSDDLIVRERSYNDNATPAANGIAAANLVRLFLLTEQLAYFDRAETTLQAFSAVMERAPSSCPSMFSALDWYRNHILVQTTSDQLAALAGRYLPTVVFKRAEQLPAGTIGLVCQGLSCNEPATTPDQLWEQIHQSRDRGAIS